MHRFEKIEIFKTDLKSQVVLSITSKRFNDQFGLRIALKTYTRLEQSLRRLLWSKMVLGNLASLEAVPGEER